MYRKGVSALIVNQKDEFLLVNLQSFKEHYFAVPGGGIDVDETLKDAVYREIQEELGILKNSLLFVGKSEEPLTFSFKLERDGVLYEGSERYFFGFKFTGEDIEIHLQSEEVRSFKWVSFENLNSYLLFDNQLEETREKIKEIFKIG